MRKWSILCALAIAATARAAIPSAQRDALVAIYNAAGGANWTNRTNWLGAPGTECTWFGVGCDETQSNVTALDLNDNNLRGTIAPDIGKLTALRDIQIDHNAALAGPLPADIGQLAALEDLFAAGNALTGSVPPDLGMLKKLQYLSLDGNMLSGPLPRELSDASALLELGLSDNQLSGGIPPELASLTNLTSLDLANNQLTGAIPAALATMPNLRRLVLAGNQLSGPIPPQLGNLPALQSLRLSYNQLSGTIPPDLGRLRTLEELLVEANRLTGAIPPQLGDLPALKVLHLFSNQLTGAIPPDLYRITTLEELDLGDNQLTGTIAPDVRNLVNLQVLNLYQNKLTGTIPVEVTTIAPLRVFTAQNNALTGTIPPDLGRLANLTWLDLATNQLTGTIPSQLGSLSKLEVLSLYQNQLQGTIPPQLGQLTNLHLLFLDANALTGTIPDTLRNLTSLEQLNAGGNALGGAIPAWVGELTHLTDLFLDANQLTGTIPAGVGALDQLQYFDVDTNLLTGPLPDLTRLTNLRSFNVSTNQLTGAIPASVGGLTELVALDLDDNAFSGPLPHEIGKLTKLQYLTLANNAIEGAIPPDIGALASLNTLQLSGNRFSGAIPTQIGNLVALEFLGLGYNALRGPLPSEVTKLTKLADGQSDVSYNALFTADAAVRDFVNRKQYDHQFEATQTVTPQNVRVTATTDRNATLAWTPIDYIYDGGGYQVVAAKTLGGPPAAIATTSSKEDDSIVVRNLDPSTSYVFTVTTITHPHDAQQNLLVSDPSPSVSAATGARVIAPADVAVTEAPQGSVQVDGVVGVADSFTLTNFGDAATSIDLERGGDDFFTLDPATFTLAAGGSQIVQVKTVSQPPGTYYGYAIPHGDGVPADLVVELVLLSVKRPAGSVVATPVATLISLAGAPGSDSVGTAQFRNSGTAELSGILISDQPWVQPDQQPITIEPNTIGSVNFRVIRSKRPPGVDGALTANLTLVYVAGNVQALDIRPRDVTPVNVAKVTVVDTTKPPVAPGSAPALLPGEVAFFAAGVGALQRFGGTLGADVSIFNASAASALSDLRLYFTPSGSAQSSVATMPSVATAQSVTLVDVVGNVYNASNAVGTLQLRSASWRNVDVAAKVTNARGNGTFTGDVPVFRSDRSVASPQQIFLAGLAQPADLFVQETSGAASSVRIDFLGADGRNVATVPEQPVGAFALLEMRDAVPAGAVTAIVTPGANGRLAAYARVADPTSGDTWSVADWSRVNKYALSEAVRVVVADGRGGGGTSRRRAVPHAVGFDAAPPRGVTDVTLFNPGAAEARANVQVIDAAGNVAGEREVVVAAKTTITLPDAAAPASSATANLVVDPTRGGVVVTARRYQSSARTFGAAIPIVGASDGLRVGQAQTFANLDDSTAQTVVNATAGTFRTGFGFVESAGHPVTVRATVTIVEARSVVAARATVSRDFQLAPRQQIALDDLVRAIAGPSRETDFGDLHGLQLQIEVTGGSGAVMPFVIVTDNGTGDSLVRLD